MLCFVFAALVVLLDQFIKRWVLLTLAMHESMDLIPGVISLTHVENPGAAFSILTNQRWLLIGIAIIAVLLLIAILLRYNSGFLGTLGLSAVLGGTIGNLVDRLLIGQVVDIFELRFMTFAIFNIADIFITLGGITFLIYFIVISLKPAKNPEALSGETRVESVRPELPYVEDQIGLYDFQYGEEIAGADMHEYGDDDAAEPAAGLYNGAEREPPDKYSEPDKALHDGAAPADYESTLSALSEMELELQNTVGLDDYDLDALLREYGFEDDED